MKTITILLLLIALKITTANAQCDSVITSLMNYVGAEDEYKEKFVLHYSPSGKLTSQIIYRNNYPDFLWRNYSRILYFYDLNDSLTQKLVQTGSDTTWINTSRFLYSYDGSGNTLSKQQQSWSGTGWTVNRADSFTYDIQNHLLSSAVYGNPPTRTFYSYNSLGLDTTEVYQYRDTSG